MWSIYTVYINPGEKDTHRSVKVSLLSPIKLCALLAALDMFQTCGSNTGGA